MIPQNPLHPCPVLDRTASALTMVNRVSFIMPQVSPFPDSTPVDRSIISFTLDRHLVEIGPLNTAETLTLSTALDFAKSERKDEIRDTSPRPGSS